MNNENYEFLCETLERHGLGHRDVFDALKTNMKLGKPGFEIKGITSMFGADKMTFVPKFEKGLTKDGNTEFYFLNKIEAILKKENGETLKAEFSLYKQRGFKAREMHNLLSGRPVYRKPRNEDGSWSKIDFSSGDENGLLKVLSYYDATTRFSLTREIDKLPVTWANAQDKEDTLQDLQSGEKVQTAVKHDGNKYEKMTIVVSPQIGGLDLVNGNGEVVKRTNTQVIEMAPENGIVMDQGKNIPEGTKALMQQLDDSGKQQGQGQKRKAS